MSSPFKIEKTIKGYAVSWPTFHDIQGNNACFNFLQILFVDMKLDQASVLLSGNGEGNIMHISAELWYSDHAKQYSEWLMSQYNIKGAMFNEQNQAEKLQEILEKRYMWKLLKL